MKPLYLELSGWGPYSSVNKIDFSKFQTGELFLITGPTGAGKTTIFDGITYALYGEVSGKIRSKNSLRSDFALPQTETYVILKFLHNGETYKIERHPKYIRPKKRGEGITEKKEEAVLFTEDGSIISGISNVNQKVREILAVDYGQFKQLSMLAQGEFMDLLTTKSNQRAEILRSIFHTQIYQTMQILAGERARELRKAMAALNHKMEEAIDWLKDEKQMALLLEQNDFLKILEHLKIKKKDFSKAGYIAEKRLKEVEKNIHEAEIFCDAVQSRMERIQKLELELEQLSLKKQQSDEKIQKIQCQKTNLEDEFDEIQKAKEQFLFLEDAWEKAVDGRKLEEERNRSKKQLMKQEQRCAAARHQQWEIYEKRKKEAEIQLKKAKKQWEQWKVDYQDVDQKLILEKEKLIQMQSEFFAANVGVLAAGLKEGVPCPVCGSLKHPNKAETVKNAPKQQDVEKQQDIVTKVEKQFQMCYQKTMEFQEKVSSGEKLLAERKNEMFQEPEWKKEWKFIEVLDLEQEEKKYQDIQRNYARLSGKFDGLPKEVRAFIEHKDEMQKEYQSLSEKIQDYETKVQKLNHQYEQEKLSLAKEKVLIEEKQEQKDQEMKLLPAETVILEKQHQKEKLCQEQKQLKHQRENIIIVLDHLQKTLKSVEEKWKKKEKLEQEYGIIGDVDKLLSGNNHLKLSLEQYVLISYFQDILRAANIRLRKMTNGRYEMFRQENVSDGRKKDHLEIEVLDYYTGKKRSIRTLSGGESFKAALCFALGLSDVIQSYAGGIQIDILFVDEGFGALDEESLNQAVDTLIQLAGEQRMIGIISHVEELKERIEHQIVITKKKEGSSIRM